jgi:predicted Rossmann fold flavoprotein
MHNFDFVIIGGGAAGFFAAINAAEMAPKLKIAIIERSKDGLQKVRISGGGRCNVTNAIQNPAELIKHYPRGESELLEPFTRFGSKETFEWFEKRKVPLKIESDGRVFPESNQSESIVDCFKTLIKKNGISVFYSEKITNILIKRNFYELNAESGKEFSCKYLLMATGSDKPMMEKSKNMGLEIVTAIPSLFTFHVEESALHTLAGTSFKDTQAEVVGDKLTQSGPLLVTHWGFSGPAILKLSAWGARILSQKEYRFKLKLNLLPEISESQKIDVFKNQATLNPKKAVVSNPEFGLSQKFWKYVCDKAGISEFQKWAETGKKQWRALEENLSMLTYQVTGKSTFKDEFVTAGGVDLEEIDFEKYESKKIPNLFFAGEILNIDGITGGFNFQSAWTGAWHVAQAVALRFGNETSHNHS